MRLMKKYVLKGTVLVYGLVIMTVVLIVLTSIVSFIASQTKYSLQVHAREEALQVAEAGIHFYKWYLAHNTDGRTAQQIQTFWNSGTAYGVGSLYEVEYTEPGGGPIGRYQIEVTPPALGSTIVTVRSTGFTYKYQDAPRTIEVRFRRPSWSEYIVSTNAFTRFGAGTETFGRIHSNYGIRFDGIAHNLVTSAVSSYNDPDHTGGDEFGVHTHSGSVDPLPPAAVPSRTDVFQGGREFPVAAVDFNGILGDLSYMKSTALAGTNGSLYFNNDGQGRHIILKTDDTFAIRTVQSFNGGNGSGTSNEVTNYSGAWQNYPIPDDGVIYVENNLWIEGAVDGRRVTVVAANLLSSSLKSVYIGKDIRYTNTDCTDIIGIIGQNDIEIYKNGENDLRIDAALLAQTGRVGRQNYNGAGSVKSTITVFGAIATNQRYGFSWVNLGSGDLVSGYETRNLYYDNNLLYCPPPYFPVGTQYEMDLWEEK